MENVKLTLRISTFLFAILVFFFTPKIYAQSDILDENDATGGGCESPSAPATHSFTFDRSNTASTADDTTAVITTYAGFWSLGASGNRQYAFQSELPFACELLNNARFRIHFEFPATNQIAVNDLSFDLIDPGPGGYSVTFYIDGTGTAESVIDGSDLFSKTDCSDGIDSVVVELDTYNSTEFKIDNLSIRTLSTAATIGGGASEVCVGASTAAFTNTTAGGAWSIDPGTGTASISSGGVVTGISAGTVTVRYTVTSGTCSNSSTTGLTVNDQPSVAAIAGGAPTVCVSATTPAFTNATAGGAWSIDPGTGTASISSGGVVTGISAGTVTVRYTVTSGTCSNSSTTGLTVNDQPSVAAIAGGAPTVCVSATTPAFTNTTAGGAWSIDPGTGTASISSGGVVTGISAGTVTVRYTVSSGGCSNSVTTALTVNSAPTVTIGSYGPYCEDADEIIISGNPTDSNGSWEEVGSVLVDNGNGTANFNPELAGVGLHTFTYTYTSGGCPASADVIVEVIDDCPEIVGVVDLSGSMSWDYDGNNPAIGDKRIDYAKIALTAFTDLLNSNFSDETYFGLVGFKSSTSLDCNANVYQPRSIVNNGNIGSINTVINNLSTGGGTPLLVGLSTAEGMYQTSGNKAMVLLSDGVHNCPFSITNYVQDVSLPSSDIMVYTIGFGQNTNVDLDMLKHIATGTDEARFYDLTNKFGKTTLAANQDPSVTVASSWDGVGALASAYSQVLTELGMSYSEDPIGIIDPGDINEYKVPVTRFDNKVCFFVSWSSSERHYLDVKLSSSDNNELPAAHPDISYVHRENYSIITVSGSYLLKEGVVGPEPWTLTLDATKINSPEKFQYLVMNQAKELKFNSWFDKEWYYTGEPLKIFLELKHGNEVVKDLDHTTLDGLRPLLGYGNILAASKFNTIQLKEFQGLELEDMKSRTLEIAKRQNLNKEQTAALLNENQRAFADVSSGTMLRTRMINQKDLNIFKKMIPIKGLKFKDDGTGGDVRAGDGIYTAVIEKLGQEGTYMFNVGVSETIDGELVKREDQINTFVRVNSLLKYFVKNVRKSDSIIAGHTVYDISLNLKDRSGNVPHPNSLKNISLEVSSGELIGPLHANPNGSFTQTVKLKEGSSLRSVNLQMTVGENKGEDKLRNRCFLVNFFCRKFCSDKK